MTWDAGAKAMREAVLHAVETLKDRWAEFPTRLGDKLTRRQSNALLDRAAAAIRALAVPPAPAGDGERAVLLASA